MTICSICQNEDDHEKFVAKEMLQGTRDAFDYIECGKCHCLQLVDPPKDMSSYYNNASYGSFEKQSTSPIKAFIRRARNKYAIRGKGGPLGKFLFTKHPIPIDFRIVGQYANPQSSILDVGCGWGNYVNDLREIGFKHAEGIDPFIEKDIQHKSGARVRKLYVEEVNEKYDVVLSHHSLEHVPDPLSSLQGMRNCLKKDGVLILTVPVAEELYRMFKEYCYLIQAPQHFFLFSLRSIELLAEQAGLKIEKTIREIDTNLDWYKISCLWSHDKTLPEINRDVDGNISQEKLKVFGDLIAKGKKEGLGDNVIFIMTKVDS